MMRVAKTEDDPIVEIPLILGIGVIAIEPALAIFIALNVEHVRVAVGVGLCSTLSMPPHLENTFVLPVLNFMRDI